jgi:hypothetical protein
VSGPVNDTRHPPKSLGQRLAVPLVWAIRIYQLVLSPMLAQQCRFYPSCSAYAVTALTRFGVVKGSWLAARRLARCHPWNPGGVDHVPPREPVWRAPTDVDDPMRRPSGTAT